LTKDYSYEDIEFLLKEYNKQPYEEDWDSVLEEIKIDFSTESDKVDYLLKRGFSVETLSYFEVCFSARRKRIVIPARNEHSKLVGFIGRTPDSNVMPKYLYSKNFPRKSILFNLNRAKKSDYVIVVEGSLDAMKVHQAGFSNVVSTLGASVTEEHSALLRKYFDKIVLFADNDEAGMAMTNKLAQGLSGYDVRVVDYSGFSSKDPGEMSEDDIRDAIMNAQDWLAVALGDSGEQGSVL
jgi:DNA primase